MATTAMFVYQGVRHSVNFRSSYQGQADYDIDGSRYYRITGKGKPLPIYDDGDLTLVRAAHAAYRRAEHQEHREFCRRRGITLGQLYRCANRNELY